MILSFPKPVRIGFLAQLLEALHHSRRIQAQRFLNANRHLLASGFLVGRLQPETGDDNDVDR
jgi:hypothetical protein